MQENTPEETEPVYTPYRPWYKGVAEGGPNNGQVMVSETLTSFVQRRIERKFPDPNTVNRRNMSKEQLIELAEAEKAQLRESLWAKQNPHRYDFDLDRKVWIYVEYTLAPLED